jgi:arginase
VFVHLDLDVLDPDRYGQANGFPERRGVTTEQILELLGALSARGQIAGLTVSAYDPAYDPVGSVREAATSLITETLRLVIPRSG